MRVWIEGETAHRRFSWGKYGRVGLNEGQIANTARINRAGVRIDSEYKNRTEGRLLMMNVYALVSKPQGRKDDENNYTIRMTDDGMMTATFVFIT